MSAIQFNHASADTVPPSGEHVTFAIRTDALHATDLLIQSLANNKHVHGRDINASAVVKDAYAKWGESVLKTFARYLDYKEYGFTGDTKRLSVQFYDARDLAEGTIKNAKDMVKAPMLISLDDMISKNGDEIYPEIAFSRLFSIDGRQELDYVARPGHRPVTEQIATIAARLEDSYNRTGKRVPIVLLEDNVRRAKMLNWVIDLMNEHGLFKYGELAGISSSFCNAANGECEKITFEGKSVPVEAVIKCDPDCVVDVATTRDLLFDGFVTEYQGTIGRLPGIFMDVAKRFKIAPEYAADFRYEIASANIDFCRAIENAFGVNPPLAWFDGGPIIAKIMNCDVMTPMADIMERAKAGIIANTRPANDDRRLAPVRAANGTTCTIL